MGSKKNKKTNKLEQIKKDPKEDYSNMPVPKDVIIENIIVKVPNKTLIDKGDLGLAYGNKYGLVGINGSGKSTLLKKIAGTELGIRLDRYYVEQEVTASNTETVFETVISSNQERFELMKELEKIETELDNNETDQLLEEYEKLLEQSEILELDKDESIVRKILFGLGFSLVQQNTVTSAFSGGWRMRMSLAKALYLQPSLLLLDEPTNHLDLNATIWLTNYLMNNWKNTLVIVSHDKEFINEVCTDLIHLYQKQLKYYSAPKKNFGVYDSFKQQFANDLKQQQKEYDNMMRQVRALQNKSTPKKKVDEFIQKEGKEKPPKPYSSKIDFPQVANLDPPVIKLHSVEFGYKPEKLIYKNIDFGIDQKSRITLVGPNGIGKSTLLKLISKDLIPNNGDDKVYHNNRLRIGYYHQHSIDTLPLDQTPIEHIKSLDPELKDQDIRKMLGSIGIEGKLHTQTIKILSGGQKSRVAFVAMTAIKPHIMLLDEPTNHLDIETVEALCDAINQFNGGIVMVTHDVDLILRTNSILWEVGNSYIKETDYDSYKESILRELDLD